MNKMHQLAKIAFVTLAVYIILGLISTIFATVNMVIIEPSLARTVSFISMFAITVLYLLAVIYFLIIKRDKWAKMIVGETEIATPPGPAAWFPLAYRLGCMIAGFYFIFHFASYLVREANSYVYMASHGAGHAGSTTFFSYLLQRNIAMLILLPFGIYLLCGAPHFVRWHVKKTLEICGQFAENGQNSPGIPSQMQPGDEHLKES